MAVDPRDQAIFTANAYGIAALDLLEDVLRFLAQQEPEALRRFADAAAERYEGVLARTDPPPADQPLGLQALYRAAARRKLEALQAAVQR